ncbi:MAG TPA: CopD family protein [Geminicoccaceae bacterium]|nr:CopD family protein [Geminicoccus sp.]HMU52423.1 CopD family protein [Geminicoccaceae bacterium]
MLRLLLIGWLVVLAPQAAVAHAVLVGASPADGQRLEAAPAAIELTFNEPVSPVSVRLLDAAGATVAGPDGVTASGNALGLALPARLPPGHYLLTYRVTSLDAHPVAGSIAFGIGTDADTAAAAGAAMPAASGWQPAVLATQLLALAGLLAAAGLALFRSFVSERGHDGLRLRIARRRRQAALLGIGATVVGVALQGGMLADLPAAAIVTAEPWQVGFASTAGRSASLAVMGGLLLLQSRTSRLRGLAALALVAASVAATGHAAAAPPRWLATAAVALHAAAASFWLGSLVGLEAMLGFGPLRRITATVRRFARVAVPLVLLLLATGGMLAALQIRHPDALLRTPYTWMLAVKLVLVAVLLGLALYNNRRLTPRLSRGDGTAALSLRRTVRAEIACMAAILLVTVTLGRTPPPRALAQQAAALPGIGIVTVTRGTLVLFEIAPSGLGYGVEVTIFGPDGQPVVADEAILRLADPGSGIEPLARRLVARSPGSYALEDPLPLAAGRWSLRLDARIGDFDKLIAETEAVIR